MARKDMRGSCHCGAVGIQVPRAPDWVGSCNCSICRRTGILWAYYRPDEVRIEAADDGAEPYIWGDRMLALHHCGTCGCISHWEPLFPDSEKMGVNALLLDGFDAAAVEIRKIDGASF